MTQSHKQLDCPGGCGNQVYHRALQCPFCGYRAEIVTDHNLLGSLSVVSSILLGFGFGGLVTLAVEQSVLSTNWIGLSVAGLWMTGSILLLAILLISEGLRRKDLDEGHMVPESKEMARLQRRCEILMTCFLLALVCLGAGLVVLGFHFSNYHGIGASALILTASLLVKGLLTD